MIPNIPAPETSIAMYAPPRLRSATIDGGSSGSGALVCRTANPVTRAAAPMRTPQVSGEPQLSLAALENP